jgi:hypothetical protein
MLFPVFTSNPKLKTASRWLSAYLFVRFTDSHSIQNHSIYIVTATNDSFIMEWNYATNIYKHNYLIYNR